MKSKLEQIVMQQGGYEGHYYMVVDLKKTWGKRYKVVDDGTNDPCREEQVSCQEIRGEHGAIYCHGGTTMSVRFNTRRMGKRASKSGYKVIQWGDQETVLQFPVEVTFPRLLDHC